MLTSAKLTTLEDLLKCDEEILQRKAAMEAILAAEQNHEINAATNKTKMIQMMGNYRISELFTLAEISKEINKLCETNPYLNSRWTKMLKKIQGYPSEDIISFDKKDRCSNFSTVKGAFIITALQQYSDLTGAALPLLNKACDLGMYHALVKRLNSYLEIIRAQKKEDIDKIDTYVQFAINDAKKLSNLYWSMGTIDAAMTLFDIADVYLKISAHKLELEQFFKRHQSKQFSWSTIYDAKDLPYSLKILKTAVEMLWTAQIISDFPESKKITKELSNNKGMLAGFETFKTPEELQKKLIVMLESNTIPKPESFCEKANEYALRHVKSVYPDFDISNSR